MCGHRDPLVAGGCYSVFDSSGTVAVLGGWGGSCLVDGMNMILVTGIIAGKISNSKGGKGAL